MKKIISLILLSLISVFAFSQWTLLNPLPTANPLLSVFFTDALTGYAVGYLGTILKTIDGSTTWTALSSGTTKDLYSVCFTDANTGYAVGYYGTMLKTVDGGMIWKILAPITSNELNSVYFLDATTGFAAGEGGTILKTTDGGTLIHEKMQKDGLKIYPNPAIENIIFESIQKTGKIDGSLAIYNSVGEEIMRLRISSNKTEMNIHSFPTGIYMVQVISGSRIETGKFIKK